MGENGSSACGCLVSIAGHEEIQNLVKTLDTTVAENIEITMQWDNASAENIVEVYQGILEYKH